MNDGRSDTPKVTTYYGRPLQDLTREELIKALEKACESLTLERNEHKRRIEFLFTSFVKTA